MNDFKELVKKNQVIIIAVVAVALIILGGVLAS